MAEVFDRQQQANWSMVATLHLMLTYVVVNFDLQLCIVLVQDSVAVGRCLVFLVDINQLVLGELVRGQESDRGLVVPWVVVRVFPGDCQLVMRWDHRQSFALDIVVVELCEARVHPIVHIAHEDADIA